MRATCCATRSGSTTTAACPITQAVLRDSVPANTTYVADSMTLNGQPVGRPDGGVSPLVAGVDVSSSDLTPPLPAPGRARCRPARSAVVQFDLRVNDGVPPGTVIVEPGRRRHGRAAEPLDRRRRQPRDRARADRRRRRQPAGAAASRRAFPSSAAGPRSRARRSSTSCRRRTSAPCRPSTS